MDTNDLHPQDDYSHRFFIWHEWIQANGPLTSDNVFDYFATSMFYDKQSNNQVLRMQTIHTGMPIPNEAEELKRFTGIEFAVVHSQPPSLFIIQKRERLSPDEVRPIAAYFIMNNRIYQSPDVYTVLSNRLLTSLHSLQTSLDILRDHRPEYTPRMGFIWPITDNSIQDGTAKKRSTDDEVVPVNEGGASETSPSKQTSEAPKRHQNNMLLLNAMRTTAAHSNSALASSTLATNVAAAVTSEVPPANPRSSTPVPPPSQAETPSVVQNAPTPQEHPKLPTAGGKKKRKRTLLGTSP